MADAVGAVAIGNLSSSMRVLTASAQASLVKVSAALLDSGAVILQRSGAVSAHAVHTILLPSNVQRSSLVERSLAAGANAAINDY